MKPKLQWRIVTSVLLTVGWLAANAIWGAVEAPARGQATALQARDTTAAYAASHLVRENTIEKGIGVLFWGSLALIWGTYLVRRIRSNPTGTRPAGSSGGGSGALSLVLLGTVALLVTGCGPYKTLDTEEIRANETAWVIPLQGPATDQVKFESVSFLEQRKVPQKRIMIDKVKLETGRGWWDYKWIPAARVIKVDRSLASRDWVDDMNRSTAKGNEGFHVVTSDGVKMNFGVTITAVIEEPNASRYLYYHGQRPLAEVLDSNVRSFCLAEFTREIAQIPFNKFLTNFHTLTSKVYQDTVKEFEPRGVSVPYLGISKAPKIEDEKIQDSMNRSYLALQDRVTAQYEMDAQQLRNSNSVLKAQAEADAAMKIANAFESLRVRNELDTRLLYAQAAYAMATNWNGQLPANVIPSDSPFLMLFSSENHGGLGGSVRTNANVRR